MYINKEEWDISYREDIIEGVVDIDVQEQQLSRCKGVSKYHDTILVLHLDKDGEMCLTADDAEKFRLKKKA